MKPICFIILVALASSLSAQDFIVKPYLQIGKTPSAYGLQVLWHSATSDKNWSAEYKTGSEWMKAEQMDSWSITTPGTSPRQVYDASLTNLVPGTPFLYRISKNNKVVFTASATAPKSAEQSYRFVASGDMGAGTIAARQVAHGIAQSKPDFVAIAGDIVYDYGLISEYDTKFWPIYNTEKMDSLGAPLMRSIPFIAAVGNHDADTRDLDKFPNALAYYLFWDQPLNGPLGVEGGRFVPVLKGSTANVAAFKSGAGNRYPRMSNFSFDYANAHWIILDADTYVDWTDTTLTSWVTRDLAASTATWKFVMFHHPGFNSSREHFEQQQMRLLAPIFERNAVDIVFNGHVHNYQRSFPMTFVPDRSGTLLVGGIDNHTIRGRTVSGKWTLDKAYNGTTNAVPHGVIYLVSGAGGQTLYNPEQNNDPDSWQKFTARFISNINSFTQVDINGKTLELKQIDVNGKTIDSISIKNNTGCHPKKRPIEIGRRL